MELIGHSSLNLVLQDRVADVLENCCELVVRAHHTIVGLVEEEGLRVHVLFDEDEASLAVATRQTALLRTNQVLRYVIISEIAKNPLNPDGVVLLTELVLLEAFKVEIARLGTVRPRLLQLNTRWLN